MRNIIDNRRKVGKAVAKRRHVAITACQSNASVARITCSLRARMLYGDEAIEAKGA